MLLVQEALPTGLTLQEAEPALQEFAHALRGWTSKRGDAIHLHLGTALSTNPNAVRIVFRIEAGRVTARARPLFFARHKVERIVRLRLRQLLGYLEHKRLGRPREEFFTRQAVWPLTHVARISEIPAQLGWLALGSVTSMILALLVLTLAGTWVIGREIDQLSARAQTLQTLGQLPFPSAAELASLTTTTRLGCGLLFAGPIAFFFVAVYWLSSALGETFPRFAGMNTWVALAIALITLFALLPVLHPLIAVATGLALSSALHAGIMIPWTLKRERPSPPRDPRRRRLVWMGGLLACAAAAMAVPSFVSWNEVLERLVRFRDTALLSNSLGHELAYFYYRHTPYVAEFETPLFSPVDASGRRPKKTRIVALVLTQDAAPITTLRHHFIDLDPCRTPEDAEAHARANFYDLYLIDASRQDVISRMPDPRRVIAWRSEDPKELATDVERVSASVSTASDIQFLVYLGWRAVYYLGPLAILYLVISIYALPFGWVYGRLSTRRAHACTAAILAGSVAALALLAESESDGALRQIRSTTPSEAWIEFGRHAAPAVRYEMVYRLALHLEKTATEPPPEKLSDAVIDLLEDPDVRVRWWATAALGRAKNLKALEPLKRRLTDPELFVRYKTCEALGRLGNRRVIPALEDRIRNDLAYVGVYALAALRDLQATPHP